MSPIRQIVYEYMMLPYHRQIEIHKQLGFEYIPDIMNQQQSQKFFEWVKLNDKLADLKTILFDEIS